MAHRFEDVPVGRGGAFSSSGTSSIFPSGGSNRGSMFPSGCSNRGSVFPSDGSNPSRIFPYGGSNTDGSIDSGGGFHSGSPFQSGGGYPYGSSTSSGCSPISPPTQSSPWGTDSRPPQGFVSFLNQNFSGHSNVKESEDVRLMSAWLKHSIDSKNGNEKKSEKYWGDVANEYNLSTPQNRVRTVKQAKERSHKINRWINWFNDAWIKVRRIYTSGYSDDMWISKAHKMYEGDHEGAKFVLMEVWKLCRYESKWMSYNGPNKSVRKRTEGEKGDETEKAQEETDLPRPMGQKAAKRAALGVEGKNKDSAIDVDALDRFEKIQENNHVNRVKLLEMQQQLSCDKEKSSKLALLAAKEQKHARVVEKEIKMLETYNNLLKQDTSEMPDNVRGEHVLAIRCLRKSLFPEIH